jgi:hypothetical protein
LSSPNGLVPSFVFFSLQCSYHYSVLDENWTVVSWRFEHIHFLFGAFWVCWLVNADGLHCLLSENLVALLSDNHKNTCCCFFEFWVI